MSYPERPNRQVEAMLLTIEVLNELDVPYWVCNGTLLGLIRDGKLIPWDVDIDFGLNVRENRAMIQEALESRGMTLHDDGSGSDYLTLLYEGAKVDINLFSRRGDEFVTLWRVPKDRVAVRYAVALGYRLRAPIGRIRWLWTLEGYGLPASALFPLRDEVFYGTRVSVPQSPDSVLEYTYGHDWKTPNRNFDWRRDGQHIARG